MFKLPELPFPINALEPYISEDTIQHHYNRHHSGYVKKLNLAVSKSNKKIQSMTLEDLITESDIDKNLYNLAAQTWNHNFYWQSIHPDAGGQPKGMMADILVKNFGSVDSFIDQFKTAAANHFGSGWTWLVKEKDGSLSVISTSDAINPLSNEQLPLLTIDVWEHAYYLDYQEKRGEYINDFVTYMLNWDFAYKNLTQSM